MKIAHVVTYLSTDHAFGGPVSVARAHTGELARRGHDVDLLCGWDGSVTLEIEGVSVHPFQVRRLVPGAGFSGLVAPGLGERLLRGGYDVIHVHLARDLITLRAARHALSQRRPYVVQPHGMVMPDNRLRARLTDRVATRSVLRGAARVLALTKEETAGLTVVAQAQLPLVGLPNGLAPGAARTAAGGVTTADSDVLFLARLHPRKRVRAFADMAALLVQRGVSARFSVVGPDEGELSPLQEQVERQGLVSQLTYEGPLATDAVPARLAAASVFVLPSVDEPFPMTVLEALAAGTPTVVTDSCHIAPLLRRHDAALVTDGSPAALADAVEQILRDPDVRHRLQEGGRRALSEEFSITAVADRLEEIYAAASQSDDCGSGR